jgi:hypothetical protein
MAKSTTIYGVGLATIGTRKEGNHGETFVNSTLSNNAYRTSTSVDIVEVFDHFANFEATHAVSF